ncbi:MAG: hypothetical protein QM820_18255 [Minicystis sp.]
MPLFQTRAPMTKTSSASDFSDFVRRWNAACWKLAVRGKAGHEDATA